MVKVWIHKPGTTEPLEVAEVTVAQCTAEFDLGDAKFLQPLGKHPPSVREPGPLGANPDPELVVFEVLADEGSGKIKPGYYVSGMEADTVRELLEAQ